MSHEDFRPVWWAYFISLYDNDNENKLNIIYVSQSQETLYKHACKMNIVLDNPEKLKEYETTIEIEKNNFIKQFIYRIDDRRVSSGWGLINLDENKEKAA